VADLTLQQAAELLGVHYMTAYRYVRLGQLPARKDGGTWHVDSDDLHLARAASPSPGRSPTDQGEQRRRAPWSARLEARLVAGDASGAWQVVEAALASGAELDEVYLDIISPAMTSIGDRWEAGELDVALEHRATGIALRLVGRLGPRFVRRGRTKGAVVLGAPVGEPHSLPLAILADLVRQSGWEVSDLGADVPDASFVHAVTTTPDLAAIGISVTQDVSLPAAAQAFAALRASVHRHRVLLVVGGRAVVDEAAGLALGADAVARDARSFVALLEQGPTLLEAATAP
jgi:excisionase family DNA binding protein